MNVSLFIAGDVVPMGRTVSLFNSKQTQRLFADILPYISADINIVNFESPVVEGFAQPITKAGPSLKTTKETLETLKDAGFDTITLANNHFRDYGQKGVEDTINAARTLGIDTVGGGVTIKEAKKILFKYAKDKTIAIINVCENEFSIATETYGGSNPIDLVSIYHDVKCAQKKADYIIVIVHGGIEMYQYPTPRMKKWYRYFVDIGADAVINHHQHCMSGYEVYNGKPIFYGIGNFNFHSFTEQRELTSWNFGYCVRLEMSDEIKFTLIPYVQNGETPTINVRDKDVFAKEIGFLNDIICDEHLLSDAFRKHVSNEKDQLLMSLLPWSNRYILAFIRRFLSGKIFDGKSLIRTKNKLTCESHYEKIKHIFTLLVEKNNYEN